MAKQAQIDAVRPLLTDIDKGVTAVEGALDAIELGADKAAGALETGLENVADVVPEALDKGVHVTAEVAKKGVQFFRNPKAVAIAIGVTGALAGIAIGVAAFRLQRKQLEKEFEERLEAQINEMRQFYMLRNKEGAFLTPRSAAEALQVEEAVQAVVEYAGEQDGPAVPAQSPIVQPKVAPTGQVRYDQVVTNSEAAEEIRQSAVKVTESATVERNIFVDGRELVPDDWNQEAEENHRQPEVPYVISHEEFMQNNFEHEQTTLTWYDADDTLADAKDEIIQEVESTVGMDNMNLFGHGSRDGNVVYIRNERLEMDFEVTRSAGSFAEEVMGLRHSDDTRFRRVRRGADE